MVAAFGTLSFYLWNQLSALKDHPNQASAAEVQDIMKKVSALLIVPTNEEPTIASVTDLNALQGTTIFC